MTKGITDPAKAEDAKVIAKNFRVKIRECDDSASKGDISKIVDNYPSSANDLSNFLLLLQDVPDEI